MTYAEILKAVPQSYVRNVEDAIEEEAKALAANATRHMRPSQTAVRNATPAAQEFFTEDVMRFLRGEAELTPNTVLTCRPRVVVAWAVAEILPPFWKTKAKTVKG